MSQSSDIFGDDGARFRVNAAWAPVFEPEWFSPEGWGKAARPVDEGGRGSAWFVAPPAGELVLRFYQRGGLMARLSRDCYLSTGVTHSRAFAEFDLLERMRARRLPVPAPVAAAFWPRGGVLYRTGILVERLASARPLPALLAMLEAAHWQSVGRVIRDFHDEGIEHADLNAFNILWVDESVYLIDFDKGRQRRPGQAGARWQRRNLDRLYRSLLKLEWSGSRVTLEDAWRNLLSGYREGGSRA